MDNTLTGKINNTDRDLALYSAIADIPFAFTIYSKDEY
jgi:hypothetical protein